MANNKINFMLVDGNSIANRAYFAFQNSTFLTTKDGFPTQAIFGFLNIFYKYFEEIKPTHVCITFDRREPTFRHLEFEGYKAKRKGMPDELAEQLPVLKDLLNTIGYDTEECAGYEADDLIGTFAQFGKNENAHTYIITGDRDALQLVSDFVTVKVPVSKNGHTSTETYDVEELMNKYGLSPKQMIDLKGLMGDSSDNIPGVKGVGEKTASELMKSFGSLENIYENLEKIEKKSVRGKLEAGKDMAFLSRKLGTIILDVPMNRTFEDFSIRAPHRGKLYTLLKELNFESYITRMGLREEDVWAEQGNMPVSEETYQHKQRSNFPPSADEPLTADDEPVLEGSDAIDIPQGYLKTTVVENKTRILEMIDSFNGANAIVFFPLFEKIDAFHQQFYGLALRDFEEKTYFIKPGIVDEPALIDLLQPLLMNDDIEKIAHDVKQIYHWCLSKGKPCPSFDFDTMLGGYIANTASGKYSIDEMIFAYDKGPLTSLETLVGKGKNKKSLSEVPVEQLIGFAVEHADAIYELSLTLKEIISENGQEDLYYNIELPLAEVLASMEVEGFTVDRDGLKRFSAELEEKIKALTLEIYVLAGEEFNVNSPKQLGVILYEKLMLKPVKKTKTGYSTDSDALEDLAGKHEIVGKITEFRQYMKLKSTYADGLAMLVNPETGRIHTTMNQAVTATGRISSTEPNLQNIPIKLELGKEIRKLFIPRTKEHMLLGADYSQIELRVLAHISEDPEMIEAFKDGLDIHTSTAAKVFGVPESKVTPQMRASAKAVNFGIVYGIGEFSLAKDIGVTRKEAKEYIESYLNKYSGVKAYMADAVEEAKRAGYAVTIMNRRRTIPELLSKNYNIRSFGERMAMNTPVQGSAADIIKIAMVHVYRKLKEQKLKTKMILQVHDELILETLPEEMHEAADILKNAMESAVQLTVPLTVDIYCGDNWRDIKNPIKKNAQSSD